MIDGWALLPHLVRTIASPKLRAVWIEAPESAMRSRLQAESGFVRVFGVADAHLNGILPNFGVTAPSGIATGLTVFIDKELLVTGKTFADAIQNEVMSARLVVLVLSRNARRSRWV